MSLFSSNKGPAYTFPVEQGQYYQIDYVMVKARFKILELMLDDGFMLLEIGDIGHIASATMELSVK